MLCDEGELELLVDSDQQKFFEQPFAKVLEGMTVDDFKRSILLAQGEFAAFLAADESVKASILERLTNTDQYKRIGQRASQRRYEVKRAYEALTSKLDGLQLLSPVYVAASLKDCDATCQSWEYI